MHSVSDVRRIEVHKPEKFILYRSPEIEIVVAKLKTYK
jgi:hypothetical protein